MTRARGLHGLWFAARKTALTEARLAVLAVMVATPAAAFTLSGRVHTAQPVEAVELRVWALGEAVREHPELLDDPVGTASVKPGRSFEVKVDAAPPLRVEAWASGHTGATFLVLDPSQRELPRLWLPSGTTVKVRVSREGKAIAGALVGGEVETTRELDRVAGRWQLGAPVRRTDARGETLVVLPRLGAATLWARDKEGRWGRSELASRGAKEVALVLTSREIVVLAENERGEPIAGAEVSQLGAPLGIVTRTGENGRATLQVVPAGEWRLVATAPGLFGHVVLRGPRPSPVAVVVKPAPVTEVAWSGPPTLWLGLPLTPAAMRSGAWEVLAGRKGTVTMVPGRGRAWSMASGWAPEEAHLLGGTAALAFRPVREARVEGLVVDAERRPLGGVPVWCEVERYAYRRMPLGFTGGLVRSTLPWGVTDAQGRFRIGELPPGPVKLVAIRGGQPPAVWGPGDLAAGSTRQVILVLAPGVAVRLQAREQDGRPLAGAVAHLLLRGPGRQGGLLAATLMQIEDLDVMASAAADEEGTAALTGVRPGPVWLQVTMRGYVPRIVAALVPPEGGDLGPQVLLPGVDVRVLVTDEKGLGLQAAQVVLRSAVAGFHWNAGITDSAGSLILADQPREGEIAVQASLKGYRQIRIARATLPAEGGVTVHMVRTRAIEGRVVDAEARSPVEGASVGVEVVLRFDNDESSDYADEPRVTDADGAFRVEGVPPGESTLLVDAPGFVRYTQRIAVPEEGEPTPLTVALSRGLSVRGRVLDPEGRPAVGVVVYAASTEPGARDSRQEATSGADGGFVVADLPRGKVELIARDRDGSAARAVVAAGGPDEAVLRLQEPGSIAGRVRAPDGAPFADARVLVSGPPPMFVDKEARSEQDGAFVAEGLAPGVYRLVAATEAGRTTRSGVKVDPGQTTQVELVVETGGTVSGLVKGLSAQDLALCRVHAGRAEARPDADGLFVLEHVEPGHRTVVAAVGDGSRIRAADTEVHVGETSVVEIDFGGVTVSGEVRRPGGPVADLRVHVQWSGGDALTTTAADGSFVMRDIPTGPAEIRIIDDAQHAALLRRQEKIERGTRLVLEIGPGALDVRVVTADGDEPVAEATVTLRSEAGQRVGTTDAEGVAHFGELASGEVKITASAPDYAAGAVAVTIREGDTSEVTVPLESEKKVTLVVRDPEGTPAEFVSIVTFREGMQDHSAYVVCEAGGRATLRGLGTGTHSLLVGGMGMAMAVVQVPGPDVPVQLREAARLSIGTPATQTSGTWRVRVLDPATGASLPVRRRLDGGLFLGWVELPNGAADSTVPVGPIVVEAQPPSGSLQRRTIAVTPGSGNAIGFE
ncbi:MAG TPA: carboxypeptidase-like regulatory domain-containing protein [Thermoanaerobaculaceae bacterium]|nr:carboxypeptidase-like regulatory domain-containing protein [Thermoanaerobaculaceae bacterium]HPS77837.1 carboxypeptidase-like regulatory domain-containing protein [Thermoanaerobaculaceae bacterium]